MRYRTLKAYKEAVDEGLEATLFLDRESAEAYDDEHGLTCCLHLGTVVALEQALDLLGIPWESA